MKELLIHKNNRVPKFYQLPAACFFILRSEFEFTVQQGAKVLNNRIPLLVAFFVDDLLSDLQQERVCLNPVPIRRFADGELFYEKYSHARIYRVKKEFTETERSECFRRRTSAGSRARMPFGGRKVVLHRILRRCGRVRWLHNM